MIEYIKYGFKVPNILGWDVWLNVGIFQKKGEEYKLSLKYWKGDIVETIPINVERFFRDKKIERGNYSMKVTGLNIGKNGRFYLELNDREEKFLLTGLAEKVLEQGKRT